MTDPKPHTKNSANQHKENGRNNIKVFQEISNMNQEITQNITNHKWIKNGHFQWRKLQKSYKRRNSKQNPKLNFIKSKRPHQRISQRTQTKGQKQNEGIPDCLLVKMTDYSIWVNLETKSHQSFAEGNCREEVVSVKIQ